MLIPVVFFAFNIGVNYAIYANTEGPVLDGDVLIIGDSHPATSLNPQLFESADNVAQTGEPLMITFLKLKKLLIGNRPKVIVLGFAPHNITAYQDKKLVSTERASQMFKRYYPLLTGEFVPVDVSRNAFAKALWQKTGLYPQINHDKNYLGRYKNDNSTDVSDWEKVLARHFTMGADSTVFSEVSIRFLDSIVELAESCEVPLVLVSSPTHVNYHENIPTVVWQRYTEVLRAYENRATVLDFTKANYSETLFRNADHLNNQGAERFTEEVRTQIEQRL